MLFVRYWECSGCARTNYCHQKSVGSVATFSQLLACCLLRSERISSVMTAPRHRAAVRVPLQIISPWSSSSLPHPKVRMTPKMLAEQLRSPEDVISGSGYVNSAANSKPTAKYPVTKNLFVCRNREKRGRKHLNDSVKGKYATGECKLNCRLHILHLIACIIPKDGLKRTKKKKNIIIRTRQLRP